MKDLTVYPSLRGLSNSGPLQVKWELSNNVSDKFGAEIQVDDEPSPATTYITPEFYLINGKAENVDTLFSLLQCACSKDKKMEVMNGSMTAKLVKGGDHDSPLASVTFDLLTLHVAASLNLNKAQLRDNKGSIVGYIELCYLSQQRWIKVNKRKLAFLNDQAKDNLKSVVQTSANYATSTLEGNKESTPTARNTACFNKLTPREDDFVLLFWNSTNTCFVKSHPDDYQLQLMLNFVKTPFIKDGNPDMSARSVFSRAGSTSSANFELASSRFGRSARTEATPVMSSRELEYPEELRACVDQTGDTPSSEGESYYSDGFNTMRSELLSERLPSHDRLYDFLSQQNEQIQSYMTSQLKVPATPSTPGTTQSKVAEAPEVPDMGNDADIIVPDIPLKGIDVQKDGAVGSYVDAESVSTGESNGNSVSDTYSDADDWCTTTRSPPRSVVRMGIGHYSSQSPMNTHLDDVSKGGMPLGKLLQLPTESFENAGMNLDNTSLKNVDRDGFPIPTNAPKVHKTQKTALIANASVSTFEGYSTREPQKSSSLTSLDLDCYLDSARTIDEKQDGMLPLKGADAYSHADSAADSVSNLDIVEDMFCSVTVEGVKSARKYVKGTKLDRFYAEHDGLVHDFVAASADAGLLNKTSMDIDSHESELLLKVATSGMKVRKHNLYNEVYNAIMADIDSCSMADLGIEHTECSLDVMSEALKDARAMQAQQGRLSDDLLLNFFLQLLSCYSQKGVPQIMYMQCVVQKHMSTSDLTTLLPEDYNSTVIRAALNILVGQLTMGLPTEESEQTHIGTDYNAPQNAYGFPFKVSANSGTFSGSVLDAQSAAYLCPLSECETSSEGSEDCQFFLPTKELKNNQLRMQQFKNILDTIYTEVNEMDPRKLVYVSRLHSKPTKRRGCHLSLLALKLVLYRVFCGRRKLAERNSFSIKV